MNRKAAIAALIFLKVLTSGGVCPAQKEMWVEPRCEALPSLEIGPFIELRRGRLLSIGDNAATVSKDDGKTWSEPRAIYKGPKPGIPSRGVVLRTCDGAIVLVYMDFATQKNIRLNSQWDVEPPKGGRRAVWSIRSLDGGKTWVDRQKIFEGYCGALINIIQTGRGQIVVPVQRLLYNPGRNGQCTYVSADDGKTWRQSNIIDIGGRGCEDGAFEGTVAELSDGRLMMLMRTALDYFWKAYSDDDGLSWRVIGPSGIDASNAPGYLARLASGRLVLVWNRLALEGREPRRGCPVRDAMELPHSQRGKEVSWQRKELSIAFSNDDGETWTEPVVLARLLTAKGEVRYPCVFERRPGELWITTRFRPHLRVRIQEVDFLENKPAVERDSS